MDASSLGTRRGPALVVLAAGESARLASCKALVRLREEEPATPLALLLDAGAALFPDERPLVVTGRDHEQIAAALPSSVELVRNADWSAGRTGSVQRAARARPGRDLCLAQVDTPLVERATFAALLEAWTSAGSPASGWLAPWVERAGVRRFGHPVLIGRSLLDVVAGLDPARPLREARASARPLLGVRVESAAILDDLDCAADLERLCARLAGARKRPSSPSAEK